MKKIILLIIPILLLAGCGSKDVDGKNSGLVTYCDKKYGVEYIRDVGIYRGGITVRLDENGNVTQTLYFDKNDRTYVAMNGMKDQPVKDISFDIRYQEHIDSINSELSWYSGAIGLGSDYYKVDGKGNATATEILSEDDEAFRTKQVYETVIKDVIIDLVKSICFLENIELSEDEIQVEFDYSRFENQEKTQQRLEREVSKGITSKVEYRMKVYGETEEVAKQKIAQIKEEEPNVDDLLGTRNEE